MNSPTQSHMRLLPALIAVAAAMGIGLTACRDEQPVSTSDVDASHTPTMLTRNVETLISDSGVIRYRITTPVWYVYDEAEDPYWNFPDGLTLDKFDNFFRKEATVRADSARYFKNKQLWRLDGNVNISNVLGEKFLTQQLFWDQRAHTLYSDSFIHIERPDKVLEGYGFDSDEQLSRYTIRRVSGIFPTSDFRGDGQSRTDGSPAPQDQAADTTVTDTITD